MDRSDSGLIKWCPRQNHEGFMHINLQHRSVKIYKPCGSVTEGAFDYQLASKYEDIPPLTTYDWSHTSPGLMAVGTTNGVVNLLRVDDDSNDYVELGLRIRRKVQAVAFNSQCKLAVGFDRVRMDNSLHIWDLGHLTRLDTRIRGFQPRDHSAFVDSAYKLEASVSVSSIRFFEDQHNTLAVGIKSQGIRIHDLRGPSVVATFSTKCNNNLAIDACDQNYFASSALDKPGIVIWDRRAANKPVQSVTYTRAVEQENVPYGAALKLDRIVDVEESSTNMTENMQSDIRSLRFCRDRRGLLGILSRMGQLKVLQIHKEIQRADESTISSTQHTTGSALTASSGPAYTRESAELLEVYKSHDMDVSRFSSVSGRKQDRIVSFDWVSLQSSNLRPRMLTLRASGKFDILEQPASTSDHIFKLIPWQAPHRGLETHEPYHDLMRFQEKDVPDMLGPALRELKLAKIPVFGPERVRVAETLKRQITSEDLAKTSIIDVDKINIALPLVFYEAVTVADKLKILRAYSREAYALNKANNSGKDKMKPKHNGTLSYRELHEDLLVTLLRTRGFPREAHKVIDHIMLLRAKEKYLFNPERNAEVVSDDPWLRNMWMWIADAKIAASDTDMGIHPLDLSYMGVSAVWNNDLGLRPHTRIPIGGSIGADRSVWERHIGVLCKKAGLPRYDGVKSQWPNHRQLCLAICTYGEKASESPEAFDEIYTEFPTIQHTRSAAKALFRGKNQQAIEILKNASNKHPTLLFVSLALQLMGKDGSQSGVSGFNRVGAPLDFDDSVASKNDPYLRAISTLIATGDWHMVAAQKSLPLADRAYVAVRNLDDTQLTTWLSLEVGATADEGDIEGIVLTGLTGRLVDIFAKYVAKFGDYQTTTLVCAMFAPRYVDDFRAHAWRTAYREYLQKHKAFLQRTKYDVESTKLSKRDDSSRPGLKPPARQIALRCVFCDNQVKMEEAQAQYNMSHHDLPPRSAQSTMSTPALVSTPPGSSSTINPPKTAGGSNSINMSGASLPTPESRNPFTAAAQNAGLSCQVCGRSLPRCAVCLEIVGMARSDRPEGSVDAAVRAAARFPSFCLKCDHVMHLDHARQWFARMTECSVPECKCQCNYKASPELMY